VLAEIERRVPRVLVPFSHGYQHGVQFGIRSPRHPNFTLGDLIRWQRFCDLLSRPVDDWFTATTAVLYACSTGDDPDGDPDTAPGSGDGSFADCLRDNLCDRWSTQCRVMAHTTAGRR
jgi:hypothetical protein